MLGTNTKLFVAASVTRKNVLYRRHLFERRFQRRVDGNADVVNRLEDVRQRRYQRRVPEKRVFLVELKHDVFKGFFDSSTPIRKKSVFVLEWDRHAYR